MLNLHTDWSQLTKPIYGSRQLTKPSGMYCSRRGSEFQNWVSTLTGYLGSKVSHTGNANFASVLHQQYPYHFCNVLLL